MNTEDAGWVERLTVGVLDVAGYRNKVYGCWLGKNVGGTLGAPLERAVAGRSEPDNITWYVQTDLKPGGAPNDDLDLQLVWLHALETRGVGIGARELAQEWLDHIWMDPDEYAIAKGNLRKGLLPPLSGSYNNWFKHSMGCPIRSEIWACVAPGRPDIAVEYAQADGCVDHGDGESVFGEMFNAAVESAAFVVSDRDQLLDLGLSMIPVECLTAQAIRDVRAGHAEGLEWRELRERLIGRYGSFNAQYSPINEAFIVLGWLYGTDFGDALCTAVNCGYDTDCTGATLGALLGILAGKEGLPARWTDPVGSTITTTASWGGIRGFDIPHDLDELTTRVEKVAARVMAVHDTPLQGAVALHLPDQEKLEALWSKPGDTIEHQLDCVQVVTRYGDHPAVLVGEPKTIHCTVKNTSAANLTGTLRLEVPSGWKVQPEREVALRLDPGEEVCLASEVEIPRGERVEVANLAYWILRVDQRPALPSVPVVLIGGNRWLVAGPFPNEDGEGFDRVYGPETDGQRDAVWRSESGEVRWVERSFPEAFLLLDEFFPTGRGGVVYAKGFLQVPTARQMHLTAPSTDGIKVWLNDELVISDHTHGPIRPFPTPYTRHPELRGENAVVKLRSGWNEVLLKFTRCGGTLEAAFLWGELQMPRMTPEIAQTRFPWEEDGARA